MIGAPEPAVLRVRNLGRDWELALDALAAAEPRSETSLRELLAPRSVVGAVPDLVIVTGRPGLVCDALVTRVAGGRSSALVAVDAPTYAGRPPARSSPVLLRLAAAGVTVAVLRRDTPIVEALGGLRVTAVG